MPEKIDIKIKAQVDGEGEKTLFFIRWDDGSVRFFLDQVKRDDFLENWEKSQEDEELFRPTPKKLKK